MRFNVPFELDGPMVAVRASESLVLTGVVVMAKFALLAPAFTDTVEGYETLESPPESVTVTPEGPAGPVSRTVPVVELPPTNDEELKLRPETTPAGLRDRVEDLEMEFRVAVRDSEVLTVTAEEVIVNVPEVAPAATVTVVE